MRAQLILIIQCLIRFCFRSCLRYSFLIRRGNSQSTLRLIRIARGMTARYSSGVSGNNVFILLDRMAASSQRTHPGQIPDVFLASVQITGTYRTRFMMNIFVNPLTYNRDRQSRLQVNL